MSRSPHAIALARRKNDPLQLTNADGAATKYTANDLVGTNPAAVLVDKHPVTLAIWRKEDPPRGPPFIKDPKVRTYLYRVGDLWEYARRHTVDPANLTPEQKLLYKSTTDECIRYESDKVPEADFEEADADDNNE
jgi:hypothetical protein